MINVTINEPKGTENEKLYYNYIKKVMYSKTNARPH